MQIVDAAQLAAQGRSVATVGSFDGVHRGHRRLLHTLRRVADRTGLKTTLVNPPFSLVIGAPMGSPVLAFQNRMVPCTSAEAMSRRSGLNATLVTHVSWPVRGAPIEAPVSVAHSRSVPS